jgi:hypothetical protein
VIELDDNYVGFLSSNNNKIIFRDITPDNIGFFGRYYKIVLDLLNRTPNTFYSISNTFNLLYTEPIDIRVAEGTFDILSIYKNLFNPPPQNSLFFAAGGFNYSTIIKYIIFMGVTTDINFHIYSDNDKTDTDHINSLRNPLYHIWIDKLIIHRNAYMGEKDFGVPLSRIIDEKYILHWK